MTLKQLAQKYQDYLKESIGWLIVWKDGRSWEAQTIYLNSDNLINMEDVADVESIVKVDSNALIINDYYCDHLGELTIRNITEGIRYMYDHCWNLLAETLDWMESILEQQYMDAEKTADPDGAYIPAYESPEVQK